MNEESWMRGQQTCPLTIYFNMWTVSSDVSTRRRHWQPLSVHYQPNPWCEWCDMWRLTTTPGSTSPTLFEQWCGFFYVPQEPDKCKCCETGPTVFRPYPRRLESLTVCRCHYKGRTLLLSYFKTLSVSPAAVRTRDLPLSKPALSLNWTNQI